MKKFLAVIAALSVLTSLTACNAGNEQSGNSFNSDQSTDQNVGQSSDQSSSGSDETDSNTSDLAADIRAAIDAFDMDDFPAPDGTVLKKADATLVEGSGSFTHAVGYEFSYVRKVMPFFRSSIDEPNMIDWDTLEFNPPLPEAPDDYGYFKIKAGDMLDNGLTVKSAEIYFGHGMDGTLWYNSAEFEGELTLDGVLYCFPEDDYNIDKGAVIFFPDTAKHSDLVTPYADLDRDPGVFRDSSLNFVVASSGNYFNIGNESEMPSDISELFRHKSFVKAKVTLKNISYRSTTSGVLSFADIVDAVEL